MEVDSTSTSALTTRPVENYLGRSQSRSPSLIKQSRSRSLSRSPSHSRSPKVTRSPSPHRDRSPRGRDRRGPNNRPAPSPSSVLGVFGLSHYTRQRDLEDIFSKYGRVRDASLVMDRRSNQSRGFGFIYFETIEEAEKALKETNGMRLDGRYIRVDFSATQRPHEPTPGVYMGERRDDRRREPARRDHDRRRYRYRSRSRSRSYERRRHSRSRSRSRGRRYDSDRGRDYNRRDVSRSRSRSR